MHVICEEALIFVLLSFSPFCELLKFAYNSEDNNSGWGDKKTAEKRLRVFGFCLSVVAVMSAFFILDSSAESLLLSQLLLSLVSMATLTYLFMSANTAITQVGYYFEQQIVKKSCPIWEMYFENVMHDLRGLLYP